jgi:glycosyltransferase involved in cell wall biosynthesis
VQKIIIIGPAHPLRGGLASFNERMALEFKKDNNQVQLFSFSLQYPSLLFPGKTQFSTEPPPENIEIHSIINSINPLNWIGVGNRIRKIRPDIVIFRYWIPFMSPCFGTIARIIRKNNFTKILCIADNILPHEKRLADKLLTNYFIKPIDGFITMSDKVTNDLLQFHSDKPIKHAIHPLYDNFGSLISKEVAREKLNLDKSKKILLFFGFIRAYKGLDLLIKAMADTRIKSENHLLLIAGEFYQDKQPYLDLIKSLQLEGSIKIVDDFIPDSMVRYYCCAADVIVQPYKNATQSGVTPLAYHFEKPMIVTNVGGLPSMVVDGETGLVCEPNPESIADQIVNYFQKGEEFFIPSLIKEKTKFSWYNFTKNIQSLANDIQK